ncbi:MAG: DUF1566 domain-containing protein [Proteobacteria bacterium]|nr:DUF1566 domain-containing protein [Pseudomonadota bacterium]
MKSSIGSSVIAITGLCFGLVFACDDTGNTIVEGFTDLCWQDPKAEERYEWNDADVYCDSLELDGYDNWRLPSRQDLIDILGHCDNDVMNGDIGECSSCEESNACNSLFGFDLGWYWSSTEQEADHSAWVVEFYQGDVAYDIMVVEHSVRCVREGPC